MRTRTAALLAAAAFTCLAAPRAHADASHAWAAAKASLPGTAKVVVGLNLAAIRKSALFAQFYPMLIAQKPDIQAGLDLAKSTCKIDPLDAIDGAVIATDDNQKAGAVFLSLHNMDQAKLMSCLQAVAAAKGKDSKFTVTRDGNISEISNSNSPDKVYIGWPQVDVLVIPIDTKDKAALQAWIGGKGALAKSAIGTPIGKINTGTAVWAAVIKDKDLDNGIKMKAGYGSVDLVGGNIAADLRLQVGSPADATKAATQANSQLSAALGSPGIPPAIATVVKSMKITSNGDEVAIKANAAEKDVVSIITTFMPHH